jgi:hypothetical protein
MKRVAVTLKGTGTPFALAGGFAAWARGGPEPGHDADFFILEEDVAGALKALEDAGFRSEQPAEDWLVKVFHEDAMVDLIHHPYGQPVTAEMLARADERDVDSVFMPVLDATDLVGSMLLALHEHYCDFTDLFPLVRAVREQVDWDEVRRRCADSPFALAFLMIAEQLGIVARAEGGG